MAVFDSLDSGRADTLKALLRDVVRRYDATDDPKDAKALAVEIRYIMAELDELEPVVVEKPDTPLDELRKRREERKKTG